MSLPVVNRAVTFSVLAQSRGKDAGEAMDEVRARLERENPDFVLLVEGYASSVEDPMHRRFAEYTAWFAYLLLESQGRADALARQLDGRV